MGKKLLFAALGCLVLLAGGGLVYLRTYGLSARAKPGAVEVWLARQVRSLATPTSVRDAVNPARPSELALAEARDHFADHCATCHGNRGDAKTTFGEGMFPPPPDLRGIATQSLTDGELMHVIREGVRFTGMPGFGGSDEENGKLAHFIRRLPTLSDQELSLMNEINHLEGTPHDEHH